MRITAGPRITAAVAGTANRTIATAHPRADHVERMSATPIAIQAIARASRTMPAGRPTIAGGFANIGSMKPGAASERKRSSHNGSRASAMTAPRVRPLGVVDG